MTHDELLAKLNDFNVALSNGFGDVKVVIGSVNAVRAVVELHKPFKVREDLLCEECCQHVWLTDYPCSTIQAIEKELM